MRSYKLILAVLTALLWSGGVFGQGFVERHIKGTEDVETNLHFIYQGVHIPVLDISYHEFSADSITWRKNHVEGDCYIRFNNYTDNSINPYNGLEGYHPDSTWWAFNFCTCNGAIPEAINTVDTLFIYYYQTDTTYIIDTVVVTDGTLNVNIPFPDTVSGSSTNFQDTLSHTHDLYVFIGDNEDVDTTGRFDGAVLKWNATSEMWEVAADLIGGGGGTFLTVTEEDNSPSVPNVNEIRVTNGHLTNNGLGSVSLDLSIDATDAENDFYRTGKVRVPSGDNFITFSSALPDTDYVVASVYAQLDWQQARQSLWYDSLAVDGFRVLDVIDSAWVHYIAIRDLDSLLLALNGTGLVYASGTDTTLGYLSTSVDDSTITVINNELHVIESDPIFAADSANLVHFADTVSTIATKSDIAGFGTGTSDVVLQGTTGYLQKVTGTDTLGNSLISEVGSTVKIGTNASSGDNSALLITRDLTGGLGATGAHALRDETTYDSDAVDGLRAYASYDAIPVVTGSSHFNHLHSFQARPNFSGSDTIDAVSGYTYQPTNGSSGTIDYSYGARISDALNSGTINYQMGLYVDELTEGTSGNFAVYTTGSTPSYFGGNVQVGGTFTAGTATFSNFAGNYGSIFSHDGSGGLLDNPNLSIVNGVLDMKYSTAKLLGSATNLQLESTSGNVLVNPSGSTVGTFSSTGLDVSGITESNSLKVNDNFPKIQYYVADQAVNNKKWDILSYGTNMYHRILSDDELSSQNYMVISRTNTTVDSVNFPNGKININGDINIASGSNYKVNGTNLASSNLSDAADIVHYTDTSVIAFQSVTTDTLNVGHVVYTDTYWDDVKVAITSAAGGVAAPDLVTLGSTGGILQYAFDGSTTSETVYLEVQFPHQIKDSSDIYPHIHFSPTTTPVATDTAVFEFEYTWVSTNSVFPTSDTIVTKIALGDVSQWDHGKVSMAASIPAIGNQGSSILAARFTRVHNHASDTYTNDLIVFTLDIHYEVDKPGSPTIDPY